MTKSCGCLKKDVLDAAKKNAVSYLAEYYIWSSILARCYNPKTQNYERYGGRGIRVCYRWRKSFKAFYQDVGPRPTPQHQIERIENKKGYYPKNVKWATRAEQARNRRSNVWLTYQGRTQCMTDWERELGFDNGLIKNRLRRGWTGDDLFLPPRSHVPYKRGNQVATQTK